MPIRLTDKSTTVYEGILHSRTLAFDYKVPSTGTARACDDNKPRLPTRHTGCMEIGLVHKSNATWRQMN